MRTTRYFRTLLLALLLPSLALSCRDPTGPGEVRLYAIAGHLAIVNDGGDPIYSIAFDEATLPLIDWIPMVCEECGKVEPGATRYVDVDSISGGGPGRWAVVFYWRATLSPGDRPIPGPISHRRIRLDSGFIN